MDSFSVASLTSTCGTISHRVLSCAVEVDELAKPLDPRNPSLQKLTKLSARLQQFRQTINQLQEGLETASVFSPTLRTTLDNSLTTCGHATAVLDKQIKRLPPIYRRQELRSRIFTLADDLLIAYSQNFKLFLQLLTM